METNECSLNKWVFDFKENTTQFKKSNVYSCKRVIKQKYLYTKTKVEDYAVIELDRPVTGKLPLTFRKFGRVSIGTPLLVIGHPLGLPMKIADGAKVSQMNDIERKTPFNSTILRQDYFTANLDSFAGNSGSPVFNIETGKVEGIVIQGADDFSYNPQTACMESNHLSNSYHNTYEKVMRITKVEGI